MLHYKKGGVCNFLTITRIIKSLISNKFFPYFLVLRMQWLSFRFVQHIATSLETWNVDFHWKFCNLLFQAVLIHGCNFKDCHIQLATIEVYGCPYMHCYFVVFHHNFQFCYVLLVAIFNRDITHMSYQSCLIQLGNLIHPIWHCPTTLCCNHLFIEWFIHLLFALIVAHMSTMKSSILNT